MKKYEVLSIELLLVQAEDVITASAGFVGGNHEFGNPNETSSDSSDPMFG